jgi:hypothetical protein
VENLQRYGTVMLEIVSEVDRGHAAAPELTLKYIAVVESFTER